MERLALLVLLIYFLIYIPRISAEELLQHKETVLSAALIPTDNNDNLIRQSRSYYDYRYGIPRPLYDRLDYARLEYDRPRCGRCDDRYDRGRDDRDDDYDRRDRYDDDRRSHRPTYGNRHDSKKNYDRDSDEDRYSDRKDNKRNNTEEENGDNKTSYDDKDDGGSRRGSDRDKNRDGGRRKGGDRDRDRYDDRDRYRPDYYDRFLRDRDRDNYDRDDYYRDRRPVYDRYYGGYDEGYRRGAGDGYRYPGYRRPGYDSGYDDAYGGYGPGVGKGPHDSFRPWDETYRGQAGWDAGGRGYYFASGRPDVTPSTGWGRPVYTRPQENGWQNVGYSNSYASNYRDPYSSYGQSSSGYGPTAGYGGAYAGASGGYGQSGYGGGSGYGQSSGWHSVGERRPYRDESGVKNLENREKYNTLRNQNEYQTNTQPSNYNLRGQSTSYGQNYPQGFQSSSPTPGTSYLFQREDEQVTIRLEDTTKNSS